MQRVPETRASTRPYHWNWRTEKKTGNSVEEVARHIRGELKCLRNLPESPSRTQKVVAVARPLTVMLDINGVLLKRNCGANIIIATAAGEGTTWLAFWIVVAIVSVVLNTLALIVVYHRIRHKGSYYYCLVSLFTAHLLSAVMVLPLLSTFSVTRLHACVHVSLVTYFAAMSHFVSVVMVVGLNVNLAQKMKANHPIETQGTKTVWKRFVILSWVFSLIAGSVPLFVSAYVVLMPVLIVALTICTCVQIRTILIFRGRVTSLIARQRRRNLERRVQKTVMSFLCVNLLFSILPYAAFIFANTVYSKSSVYAFYTGIVSKLPFLKGLAECLVYCCTQYRLKRSVAIGVSRTIGQAS